MDVDESYYNLKPTGAPSSSSSSSASAHVNLPFVEKYRPGEFKDIISHTDILNTLNNFIENNKLPHLLFHGPPGTGKTTTILACARKMYGANFSMMTLELNASDERGIDTVRNQVKTFAGTKSIISKLPKLIILDECDAMLKEAQFALRRVVEMYSSNARFCLVCNYVGRIIPALQSRCTKFRFSPLSPIAVCNKLREIAKKENIKMGSDGSGSSSSNSNDDGIEAIVGLSGGDMRKCLNILQSVWISNSIVNTDTVYQTVGKPHPREIHTLLNTALNSSFEVAVNACWKLKLENSYSLTDILGSVFNRICRVEFPPGVKCMLLDKLACISNNITKGYNERIQFVGMISALQEARMRTMRDAEEEEKQKEQAHEREIEREREREKERKREIEREKEREKEMRQREEREGVRDRNEGGGEEDGGGEGVGEKGGLEKENIG